jgi:hypothetical protein
MKRLQSVLLIALIAFAGTALPVHAAKKKKASIKIINSSKWEIHHLYLSSSDDDHWGEDQLGKDVLEKGDSITLTDIDCGDYDIKVVDEDGDECVIEDESLCGDATYWKITDKELLACENGS